MMELYNLAVTYFDEEVLHNGPWLAADEGTRNRALKNAANELYNEYPRFDRELRPIPEKAIFEQALWLLRKDDSIMKAEMGVTNINISGEFSLGLGGKAVKISPNAKKFLRSRKVGRYSWA